jgi:hypothetical protein
MSILFHQQPKPVTPSSVALLRAKENRKNYGVLRITEAVKAAFNTIETPKIELPHRGLKSQ